MGDGDFYTGFTENLKLRFEQKAQILFNRVKRIWKILLQGKQAVLLL